MTKPQQAVFEYNIKEEVERVIRREEEQQQQEGQKK